MADTVKKFGLLRGLSEIYIDEITDTAEAEEVADRILKRNSHVSVAYSVKAVGLDVRLVNHVHTNLVTHIVKTGVGGVMAATDGVHIVSLHDIKVTEHMLGGSGITKLGVAVVTVYTHKLDGLTVYKHDSLLDLNTADTYILLDIFVAAFEDKCIKIGVLT